MFFIYRPQTPTSPRSRAVNARSPSPARRPLYQDYDPDEAFVEFKRREYIAALEEAEQRAQFRRELAVEEERHRRALEHIAAQETVRRQNAEILLQSYAQQAEQADEARQALRAQRELQERQQALQQGRQGQQDVEGHPHPHVHAHPHSQRPQHPNQPTPQEILRRRLERQKEEEHRSREFHRRILSDIFGVPVEIEESHSPVQRPRDLPKEVQPQQQQQVYEPEQPDKEEEPHWSEAPKRARALAEIASINRAFLTLKNTFSFPSGQLERDQNSDVPKLAYNPTNATIHAYEHALTDLLSKLDGIESHGFKGVRMARKQLVVKIEEEVLAVERKIAENLAPASASAPAPAPVAVAAPAAKELDIQDVEMAEEVPSHTPNSASYEVDVEDLFVAPTPSTGGAAAEPTTTTTTSTAETPPLASDTTKVQIISDAQTAAAPEPAPAPAEATMESTSNTPAAPTAPSAPGATTTATGTDSIPAKHTPTISVSDEENEIDDAAHVITVEDGTKAHTIQEEGYERL